MLKLLMLVQDEQLALLDRLYEAITVNCDCDLKRLDKHEQKHLAEWFKQIDVSAYDCILLMTRAKYAMSQTRFLKRLPNLAFLEHDACQNYIKQSKYKGKFSKFYKSLPDCIVLASSHGVTQRLRAEGIDCHFVPKGYDQALLSNLQLNRDIDCAFVGSLNNRLYKERKRLLEKLEKDVRLQLLRTESSEDYLQTLNRIRFFISADIGFSEYMLKTFEAMACGCLVFAFDQGEKENEALGFKDMENIVLYRHQDELLAKLAQIRNFPQLDTEIRQAGQLLAENHFRFELIGSQVVNILASKFI